MSAAFSPLPKKTVSINVSSTSQNVLVSPRVGAQQVLVTNEGTATAWFGFGDSTVTATAGDPDIALPAGSAQVFTLQNSGGSALYCAVIAAGSTGYVSFTPGSGI